MNNMTHLEHVKMRIRGIDGTFKKFHELATGDIDVRSISNQDPMGLDKERRRLINIMHELERKKEPMSTEEVNAAWEKHYAK